MPLVNFLPAMLPGKAAVTPAVCLRRFIPAFCFRMVFRAPCEVYAQCNDHRYNDGPCQFFKYMVLDKFKVAVNKHIAQKTTAPADYGSSHHALPAPRHYQLRDHSRYHADNDKCDQRFVICEFIYNKLCKDKE
jgi:hypothetical protein